MDYTLFILFAVVGYFAGAIPFSLIFARAFGIADPRTFGSGNPGATNIARTGNKLAALLTLIADAGKGALPIVLATMWMNAQSMSASTINFGIAIIGIAAVIGHIFSIFLRFGGGKGVATAFGVLAVWHSVAFAAAGVCWLMVFMLFRLSSAASIVAMIAGAGTLIALAPNAIAVAGFACALLVIFRHRQNIHNIFSGKEQYFGGHPTNKKP